MHSKARAALEDIRENILLAQHIIEDIPLAEFEKSRVMFYAATRCLEIISEASRRLPKEMRDRHTHIPWRQIMDAGNFYRHQYAAVAEKFVWRTIRDSLPPLMLIVSAELNGLAEG